MDIIIDIQRLTYILIGSEHRTLHSKPYCSQKLSSDETNNKKQIKKIKNINKNIKKYINKNVNKNVNKNINNLNENKISII